MFYITHTEYTEYRKLLLSWTFVKSKNCLNLTSLYPYMFFTNSQTDTGTKIIFVLNVKARGAGGRMRVFSHEERITEESSISERRKNSVERRSNIFDLVWPLVSPQFVSAGWRTSWRRMLEVFEVVDVREAHLHELSSLPMPGWRNRAFTHKHVTNRRGETAACVCMSLYMREDKDRRREQ